MTRLEEIKEAIETFDDLIIPININGTNYYPISPKVIKEDFQYLIDLYEKQTEVIKSDRGIF